MLDRKIWNSETQKGIIGHMIFQMGKRAESLERTQSEACNTMPRTISLIF